MEILKNAGFDFIQKVKPCDETFPETLLCKDIALYLAEKKMSSFKTECADHIIITADTIVILDDHILGKPNNHQEAYEMLSVLSGRTHEVITGVCIQQAHTIEKLSVSSKVEFRTMKKEEMDYYIEVFKPFDKAGSYGIQDWLGLTVVKNIEGSYYNVMGLPMYEVYQALRTFSV